MQTPWINIQLSTMICSPFLQNGQTDSNQKIFTTEQQTINSSALDQLEYGLNIDKQLQNEIKEIQKLLEPNSSNLLSRMFKLGDRIKVDQGTSSATGVFIRSNNNVLIWVDDVKECLSISNIDHIIVSKL
ncbi:hypothetical protein [Priestia endophytica]|uniref:hypothetical protein n=1 Tax=Priestia endophytica TaxID=135735 RepID=UPI002282484B|nr:hypothetical protein [Priestia endophytica]MCY8235449.1 hypothetical protein [Priestia endophytica]